MYYTVYFTSIITFKHTSFGLYYRLNLWFDFFVCHVVSAVTLMCILFRISYILLFPWHIYQRFQKRKLFVWPSFHSIHFEDPFVMRCLERMPSFTIVILTSVDNEIVANVKIRTVFSKRAGFCATDLWVSAQNYCQDFLVGKTFEAKVFCKLFVLLIVLQVVTLPTSYAAFADTVQVKLTNMKMAAIRTRTSILSYVFNTQ